MKEIVRRYVIKFCNLRGYERCQSRSISFKEEWISLNIISFPDTSAPGQRLVQMKITKLEEHNQKEGSPSWTLQSWKNTTKRKARPAEHYKAGRTQPKGRLAQLNTTKLEEHNQKEGSPSWTLQSWKNTTKRKARPVEHRNDTTMRVLMIGETIELYLIWKSGSCGNS